MEEEKIFKSTTAFLFLKGVICMKLTYHRCGDYLLPDLTIPDKPGTVKYYAQIHLQVWQNSVCTGQGNLPLIA